MKKYFKFFLAIAIFTTIIMECYAQDGGGVVRKSPPWVSENGYWVVVSNIRTPETANIYFYNNDNVEVYHENLAGIKLRLHKKKTKIKLTRALDAAVSAWNMKSPMGDNEQVVAQLLRKN